MSVRADRVMTVLVAPDSFKGTMSAEAAAAAIRAGWWSRRPSDDVRCVPQADGGEGTAATIASTVSGARWHDVVGVRGPDGSEVLGRWLELPNGIAVVELAQMSGITLMSQLDPDIATTYGFGQVIAHALSAGAQELVLCLGGSASNDGGAGALRALGVRLLDECGHEIPDGAAGLDAVHTADMTDVMAPPSRGVTILTDVTAPLLGPQGATAVFGPQKGIVESRIGEFESRLQRLAELFPDTPRDAPGAGAAGGTAFGLLATWGAEIASGAEYVARLTGLTDAVAGADLVVTGEGRYDHQSSGGKVVGTLQALASAHGVPVAIVAGRVDAETVGPAVDLGVLAGDTAEAIAEPLRYARLAGARLAAEAYDHAWHYASDVRSASER